ncbi:MAG: hypothetical protein U9Q68_11380 [Euryarchaeota archaeon]|nr:hypothetical protein [Euryarchaeota archaeon]
MIAETNWLENLVLVQYLASAYLTRLARSGEIEIAVPEYSFHGADGSLNRKHNKRAYKVDESLSLLGQISQTEHHRELCENGRAILKDLKKSMSNDRSKIKKVLDNIKSMVQVIPYTSDASTRAELIFESACPLFKKSDCRIYASLLMFVEQIRKVCDLIIFYTEDKEDFDHHVIRDEFCDHGGRWCSSPDYVSRGREVRGSGWINKTRSMA